MVIQMAQYNIRPDKSSEYQSWIQSVIPVLMGAPGIAELQAYRNITGDTQVTVLYIFDNLANYASWRANEAVDQAFADAWDYVENWSAELLDTSPGVPEPLKSQ